MTKEKGLRFCWASLTISWKPGRRSALVPLMASSTKNRAISRPFSLAYSSMAFFWSGMDCSWRSVERRR